MTPKENKTMSANQQDALRTRIVRIIVNSAEGGLTEQELASVDGSLSALGYSSLSYIRMIDAVENELGVYLDPEVREENFATVDGILALVREELPEPAHA
ncbi:phosphopantetheine-binding protein [Streptomyces sp. NPDC002537]